MEPKQPAEKPDAYWDWHKSEPKSPEIPVRTTRFEPPQRCSQGPFRFTVDAVSSQFSESVHITICTAHDLKGSISYLAPGYSKSETGFGASDAHHDTCRADATVVASSSSATGKTEATASRGNGKPTTAKPAAPTTVELRGVLVETGDKCPDNAHAMSIVNASYSIGEHPTRGDAAVPGSFVFELWSELPNDLQGVSILVEQRGVPAGYKLEDWLAYRTAWDAWYKRHDAALAESLRQGNQWKTVAPVTATAQPPPPRAETPPPRPSPNAAWIPGYWQFTDGWIWSAGFWRVPHEDVEQEKTVEAPTPPPAPRTEAAPDVAYYSARKAVWTPGHWMWNGTGYIWIGGAWRIPEAPGLTWVAPSWRPTRRGTSIFVPGGFIRIGRH